MASLPQVTLSLWKATVKARVEARVTARVELVAVQLVSGYVRRS